jgi:hypothetical protein
MGQSTTLTKQLAAASATAICASQPLGAAGNLLINGADAVAGVAILDTQRRVLITSGGNDSGIKFTVTGTNDAGVPISETLAGANAGAVATQQDFLTVTQVAASGAVATTVEVGTNTTGSTRWWVPNYNITPFEVSAAFELLSGAVTASVEVCDESVLAPLPIYQPGYSQAPPIPNPYSWLGLGNMVGPAQGVVNRAVSGIRLTITLGAGQGELILRQSGIRN